MKSDGEFLAWLPSPRRHLKVQPEITYEISGKANLRMPTVSRRVPKMSALPNSYFLNE